jgi:hypothetical protein
VEVKASAFSITVATPVNRRNVRLAPPQQQAKPAPDRDPGIAGGNTARVYNFHVARLTADRQLGAVTGRSFEGPALGGTDPGGR